MFADRIVEIKIDDIMHRMVKFIYSEKATKFCKIFPLLLTTVHTVKSKGKILQNFVAFSEYMNFNFKVIRPWMDFWKSRTEYNNILWCPKSTFVLHPAITNYVACFLDIHIALDNSWYHGRKYLLSNHLEKNSQLLVLRHLGNKETYLPTFPSIL